jgi:hypothetical protein
MATRPGKRSRPAPGVEGAGPETGRCDPAGAVTEASTSVAGCPAGPGGGARTAIGGESDILGEVGIPPISGRPATAPTSVIPSPSRLQVGVGAHPPQREDVRTSRRGRRRGGRDRIGGDPRTPEMSDSPPICAVRFAGLSWTVNLSPYRLGSRRDRSDATASGPPGSRTWRLCVGRGPSRAAL